MSKVGFRERKLRSQIQGRLWPFLSDKIAGKGRGNSSPAISGLNFQISSQLPHSFAHALDTHPRTRTWHWHTLAAIANLQFDFAANASDGDSGELAAGMAVDVREALLNDAEDCGFKLSRRPSHVCIQLKIDFDLASFGESFDVPAYGGMQPGFIE